MSSRRQPIDPVKRGGPLQIEAELGRVRQRAKARLGTGIDRRSVEAMLSKLEKQNDEEKNRND